MIDLAGVRRLNFGCGFDKRAGYLNVDMDPACEPDLLLVDNDLSVLARDGFEEILALDVLEHIPRVQTPAVLLEWADLLVNGGKLRIQTSSIRGVAGRIAKDPSFEGQYGWTLCLFGSQAHPGDFHLTGFTKTTLKVHLLAAGFDIDRMWTTDHWLLNAEATKVASWSGVIAELADLPDNDYLRRIHQAALHRDPNGDEAAHLAGELTAGRMDRRDVARVLMSSRERLLVTADRHGFNRAVKRPVAERIRPHVPDPLVPPLRSLYRTARTTKSEVAGHSARWTLSGSRPELVRVDVIVRWMCVEAAVQPEDVGGRPFRRNDAVDDRRREIGRRHWFRSNRIRFRRAGLADV